MTKSPKHVELLLASIEWAMVEDGEDVEGRACVDSEAVRNVFKDRYDGSKDASNFKKKWDTVVGFATESGAVTMIPFNGRRYMALPSFT